MASTNNKRSLEKVNDEEETCMSKYFKSSRLGRCFYEKNCIDLGKDLLGKVLCRKIQGHILKGMIVETESYLGGNKDGASHSYNNKRTARNAAMYESAGTCYGYKIYGSYHCFNIISKDEGSAVLIRGVEALSGAEIMLLNRSDRRKDGGDKLKPKDVSNGPSKLCDALNITKENTNMKSLLDDDFIWLEDKETVDDKNIVTCKRIGIEGAGKPWSDLALRFYILGNKSVSVREKSAENKIIQQSQTSAS